MHDDAEKPRALLERIGALAEARGLRCAAAAPLAEVGDARLTEWLESGYAGEMAYIADHAGVRLDPGAGFAPFVSVITFLAPYDRTAPDPSPEVGNIARYALGDDYHDVLKRRLHEILDELRGEDAAFDGRALVDTAPLLEKRAAVRAGLGWQGKHTNVIREDSGSWFFLAELLINRAVPAGEPAKDRCGLCADCIPACPTGAIVAPYVLDSRRCISYLTIELRGDIPVELRPLIGNRIFGCDDCQEVCPWNRFAAAAPIAELRARPGLRARTLVEWMDMTADDWRAVFRRSAVKRARYDGFKRNVAVALGNARPAGGRAALERALERESDMVRRHARWALERYEL